MSEEDDAVEDGAMRSDDDVKIKIKIMMVDAWDNGRVETWWRILL